MLNFPVPHPDELIYSTIARAGLYHGLTSPKQLLDEVFGDRKIIATMDLPCHLIDVVRQLQNTGQYSVEQLVYQHTMFPLYAPFVTNERRNRALQMMASKSKGAVHLMLGVVASRIRPDDRFRYCPECLKIQRQKYGEYFWQRNWYLPGLPVCPQHGALVFLSSRAGSHRHAFSSCFPVEKVDNSSIAAISENSELCQLANLAVKIMTRLPSSSPSFSQWTQFYRDLASDFGFCRGKKINHAEINLMVTTCFRSSTLSVLNLSNSHEKTNHWLVNIFRKHRKSFSYLQHMIVWKALLNTVEPADIVAQVLSAKLSPKIFIDGKKNPDAQDASLISHVDVYREAWKLLVSKHGVLQARKQPGKGGVLYAWLYRHDKRWLLEFNASQKIKRTYPPAKLDWHSRDLAVIRQLRKIVNNMDSHTDHPRLSKCYLLNMVNHHDSIEKNLDKLPLVSMFLQRYSETVTEYQLRRLNNVCIEYISSGESLKRWAVLRKAGLSDERLTSEAKMVLDGLKLF